MNLFKITTTVFTAALLTSCSGNGAAENSEEKEREPQLTSLCDCVKFSGNVMEEIDNTNPAEKTRQEIEASYTDQFAICDSISKEYQSGFDELSQEDLLAKQQEFFKDCPEAEALNKKMEARMQQQMQQQQMQQQMQQQQGGGQNGMQQPQQQSQQGGEIKTK